MLLSGETITISRTPLKGYLTFTVTSTCSKALISSPLTSNSALKVSRLDSLELLWKKSSSKAVSLIIRCSHCSHLSFPSHLISMWTCSPAFCFLSLHSLAVLTRTPAFMTPKPKRELNVNPAALCCQPGLPLSGEGSAVKMTKCWTSRQVK